MKEPKNVRIILIPVEQYERRDLEQSENSSFTSNAQIVNHLFHTRGLYMNGENFELKPLILTPSEFRKLIVFTKAHKPFNVAMANIRKRKQCYNLSEFMDEFNNQDFGEDTDKYWMGYAKLK
jgi:hypothetical protein